MTGEETLNLYLLFPARPQVDVHVARHSISLIRDPKFTPLINRFPTSSKQTMRRHVTLLGAALY